MQVRPPVAAAAALRVARPNEEPVRPRVETRRIAERREVPPDRQECLLGRVLGEIRVAEDPVRHGVEPVADRGRELREGVLVAVLRPDHEGRVHLSDGMGAAIAPATQSFGAASVTGFGRVAPKIAPPARAATSEIPSSRSAVLVCWVQYRLAKPCASVI